MSASDYNKTIRQTVFKQSGDELTHFRSVFHKADCYHMKW